MFKGIRPVCPTTDMAATLVFWRRLGFQLAFSSLRPAEEADYAGMRRDDLELHFQTFTPEERTGVEAMALRIEVVDRAALDELYAEWEPLGMISAPLEQKPWGTFEFGFYTPERLAVFVYVDA